MPPIPDMMTFFPERAVSISQTMRAIFTAALVPVELRAGGITGIRITAVITPQDEVIARMHLDLASPMTESFSTFVRSTMEVAITFTDRHSRLVKSIEYIYPPME